jgi:hypothetical protein
MTTLIQRALGNTSILAAILLSVCERGSQAAVVITYDAIWLFTRGSRDQSFFDADISWGQYASKQIEAVCFADNDKLLLADEQLGELFEVSIGDLIKVRSASPVPARSP